MNVFGDRVLELGPAPDATSPYKNFKLTRDADGIAWLLFDREESSANTLNAAVLEEFDKVLGELESPRPAGLVIRSAKKSGFIAGADVNEFRSATDPRAVETEIGRAHARDFIAGMTDRYAVSLFERLFIPRPWVGLDMP